MTSAFRRGDDLGAFRILERRHAIHAHRFLVQGPGGHLVRLSRTLTERSVVT